MNRYDLALGKKPGPDDIKKRQQTHQDPVWSDVDYSSGLFQISKIEPTPYPRPIGLAFALRAVYNEDETTDAFGRPFH